MPDAFERLVGDAFEALPAPVRRLHREGGRRSYDGEVVVRRGRGPLARLCGWATRLPPSGAAPIQVEIDSTPSCETWSRHVGGHVMASRLWDHDGLLHERLGLVTFGFRLEASAAGLRWTVARVRALGLPLPAGWFRDVRADETEQDGRYAFRVTAALPGVGLLVDYRGTLDVR